MANLDYQGLQSLFGQASPYAASLLGESLGRQDAAAPIERRKTLADITGKELSNQQAQQQLDLSRLTQQYDVDKARLGTWEQEENILGKRHDNWSKGFENRVKNDVGEEHFVKDKQIQLQKSKIEKMEKVYQHLGIAAVDLANEGDVTKRHTKLNRYLDAIGLSEEQREKFFEIPAEMLPQALKEMADQVAKAAPDFIQKSALQAQTHKNAMELAKLKASLDQQLEKMKAGKGDAKTYEAAVIRFRNLANSLPPGPEKDFAIREYEAFAEIDFTKENQKNASPYEVRVDDKGRKTPEFVGKPPIKVPSIPRGTQAPQSVEDIFKKYGL